MDSEAAVEAGARLLDAVRPGWAENVRVDELACGNPDKCVLGQLYGSYDIGARELRLDWGRGREVYGVTILCPDLRRPRSWATLDRLWAEAIQRRRNP